MNQVHLIGNITRDLELKEAATGTKYVQFAIAVDSKSADGHTNFIDVVAFNKQAELLTQYTDKGKKIEIEGHLNYSQYIDKDGNKRNTLKVILDRFELVDKKENTSPQGEEIAASTEK